MSCQVYTAQKLRQYGNYLYKLIHFQWIPFCKNIWKSRRCWHNQHFRHTCSRPDTRRHLIRNKKFHSFYISYWLILFIFQVRGKCEIRLAFSSKFFKVIAFLLLATSGEMWFLKITSLANSPQCLPARCALGLSALKIASISFLQSHTTGTIILAIGISTCYINITSIDGTLANM